MKYVDEFRDEAGVEYYINLINEKVSKPWRIMEICGGQTHAIKKYGLDQLLPEEIKLLHGPGCPVCVTPQEVIDQAVAIAQQENVIVCSYGDMLRVPGDQLSLLDCKARGADVRVIYSPLEAVRIAQQESQRQVVLFAIGFETTAPGNAAAIKQAKEKGLDNFSALVCQVTVPAAIDLLMSDRDNRIDGFLAAGHVCTVMGYHQYHELANTHKIPIVITGFEPVDLLAGIAACVDQLEQGKNNVDNAYKRFVSESGNGSAQALLSEVFSTQDQTWRGIGTIANSGLGLHPSYVDFDARVRFASVLERAKGREKILTSQEQYSCQSGLVLQGRIQPNECPLFGKGCSPENPRGATMVSNEGACAAYFHYDGNAKKTSTEFA